MQPPLAIQTATNIQSLASAACDLAISSSALLEAAKAVLAECPGLPPGARISLQEAVTRAELLSERACSAVRQVLVVQS